MLSTGILHSDDLDYDYTVITLDIIMLHGLLMSMDLHDIVQIITSGFFHEKI